MSTGSPEGVEPDQGVWLPGWPRWAPSSQGHRGRSRARPGRPAPLLAEPAVLHARAGQPVISVDAKREERVGPSRAGAEVSAGPAARGGERPDLRRQGLGKVMQYGIYDVSANPGRASVGNDHDTPAFVVATLCTWRETIGIQPPDRGGVADLRRRGWLHQRKPGPRLEDRVRPFAADTGPLVTVCDVPAGTSNSNRIRHRL